MVDRVAGVVDRVTGDAAVTGAGHAGVARVAGPRVVVRDAAVADAMHTGMTGVASVAVVRGSSRDAGSNKHGRGAKEHIPDHGSSLAGL
jgi:hypothetical protein